jgi:hypothetical protein
MKGVSYVDKRSKDMLWRKLMVNFTLLAPNEGILMTGQMRRILI